MMRYPFWLFIAAAIVGVLVAVMLVIPAPDVKQKQKRGSPAPTLDAQRAATSCYGLSQGERARCLADKKR